MPIARVADLRARYEAPIGPADEPRVAQLLIDAESRLRAEVLDLDERMADNAPPEELVVLALCDMVSRVIRNPAGYTSQTVGSLSYSISATGVSGRLEVTAAERALLGIRGARSRATTIPYADHTLTRPFVSPPGTYPAYDPWKRARDRRDVLGRGWPR